MEFGSNGAGWRRLAPTSALVVLSVATLGIATTDPVQAQGRLDARYEASLAGIPVGKGSWVIDIGDDQYSATAVGGSAGLLKAFSGGHGTSASQGRIVNGQLVPSSYQAMIAYDSKAKEVIRVVLAAGNVKESSIDPQPQPQPDRIPVTDVHRKGVTDPMTGSLLRASGNGDPLTPDACKTTTPVFDGRMRYDLRLEFKRMDRAKTKGYQGPVVVCAIYFAPLAGYVPDRAAIKYLIAQRDMEVWMAPIAGTRVLVPLKVLVPTPIGMAALEATQFVSTAAVRTTAKTQ
ncbi:DUF3108 domain-containing protein [Bradyrhizobium sp. WD16]|uniref:DUF3108 domain-containing protein n=1 Tax=Bradyrhizobium sp. WD16 TaxID=1521768 RepID=UPI0021FD8625|nr:DUF3108 domain-containing protein [Bradyrhizobium sp. WD16]